MQSVYHNNRLENRRQLLEKKSQPCKDCGLLWHPAIMTLDHVDRRGKYVSSTGKRMSPSGMLTYDPLAFKQMLSTLDAVCFNCHMFREHIRDGKLADARWQPFNARLSSGALLGS